MSNETLIDSYFKAIDLKLDEEFIRLLLAEIRRRRLHLDTGYDRMPKAAAN
ncbi:sporulation histidine kinase inhibitor Sda [Paenibacillus chartarius]|uniref:Sporulation histidine kinase inhibitor Sda n=1 Tax=Paenibacillus chartarius TaxID=747481 RepID=A0ABV6DF92_9BACL